MFAGVGAVGRVGRPGLAGAGAHRATFDQSFLGGSLGAGAVFTRASAGWYYNSSGVLVQAGVDVPRFDYDPVTLQLKGLLLEDTSTNVWLNSSNAAAWTGGGTLAITATANQTTAPDGTVTAARAAYPAVSVTATSADFYTAIVGTTNPYTFSVWMRGTVGGEQLYLMATVDGANFYKTLATLTTTWQRFTLTTPALTTGTWYFQLGVDLHDATQTAKPAQNIFVWGAQVELNFTSSYIPTTTAVVTRAVDVLSYPIASVNGFSTTQGSLVHEYILVGSTPTYNGPAQLVGANSATDFISPGSFSTPLQTPARQQFAGMSILVGGTTVANSDGLDITVPLNTIQREALSWRLNAPIICAFGGVGLAPVSGPPATLPAIVALTINGTMLYQSPLCGQWARRTRYWPRQLSQAELIATTTLDGPTLSLDFMTPGALDPRIVFTRASTATYTDANGTIQTAAVNAPRWDYDPVTHALRGLLIEEARTNKLTNSGAPSAWGPVNIVQTNNAAVAPDGTTTAAKIADNVTNNQHAVNPAGPAITANTTNIFSVYLKAAGRPRALLYYASGSNSITATFDLTNGTMVGTPTLGGLASGAVWSITAVGNGWYRCAAGGLLDATSTAASTYVFIDNGTTSSYLGDGVSGLLVWGAQCEQGAFPTSYIPTTAATVTRAADVATMPTDVTKWYSTLNGTVLAEALLPPNGNVGYRGIFTLDGGPFNAWLRSYITGGTSNVDGNIDIASLGFGVMTPGTVFKCVATYSSAGSHCTLNGVMGVGSATVGTPSTWTTLRLGVTDGTNNNPANGYLRRLTYWNRALSDTEMQQVTT